MRQLVLMTALLALSATASADADGTKFWGQVQKDDHLIAAYYITLPAGESATLSMKSGYRMEFEAAAENGDTAESKVRLFDPKGKQLHSRSMPGNTPMNVSGSYSLCGRDIAFISPAPSEPSGCSD